MRLPFVGEYLSAQLQKLLVGLVLLGAALNAGLWYAAMKIFPQDDPAAVLHYSIDVGIDFIGEGKQIIALPLIGSLILIMNTVVGLALARADLRTSWILWSISPIAQIILAAAFYLLWRINA